jgi:hypothetical protein
MPDSKPHAPAELQHAFRFHQGKHETTSFLQSTAKDKLFVQRGAQAPKNGSPRPATSLLLFFFVTVTGS